MQKLTKAIFAIFALLASGNLIAFEIGPPIEELVKNGDIIVLGSVEKTELIEPSEPENLYDNVSVRILYVFKNKRRLKEIKIDKVITFKAPSNQNEFTLSTWSYFEETDVASVWIFNSKKENYGVRKSGSYASFSTEKLPEIIKILKNKK